MCFCFVSPSWNMGRCSQVTSFACTLYIICICTCMCITCAIFFGRIGGLSTGNLLNFRCRWNIPAAHAAPARHKAARMDGKHSSLEMLRFLLPLCGIEGKPTAVDSRCCGEGPLIRSSKRLITLLTTYKMRWSPKKMLKLCGAALRSR